MRLHELAKKHGYNQQDLLTAVRKQGFDVKDALTVVDGDIEKWVAGQAREGWTPPPPDKAKAVKKKKVLAKPAAAPARPAEGEPSSESEAAADSGTPSESATAGEPPAAAPAGRARPSSKSPLRRREESAAKSEKPPDGAEPSSAEAAAPAGQPARGGEAPAPAVPAGPEPAAEAPAPPSPPPVIKRVGTTIKGSAAVGQASAATIAAIKRSSGQAEFPRAAAGADKGRAPGKAAARKPPAGARPPPGRPEAAPPDPDASGKPVHKHRIKAKPRAGQDAEDRELSERRAKAPGKRGKSDQGDDWGLDDIADAGDYEVQDEAASAAPLEEGVASGIIAKEDDVDRVGAGFKHKRADFKSRQAHRELPAGFAELDSEFARSLAGGGGRRRSGRGAQRRAPGRRSRTRRIAAPVQPRAPGQTASVRLGMTLRDLSVALGVKLQDLLSFLLAQGNAVQVNDILSEEDVVDLAKRFNIPIEWESEDDLEEELAEEERRRAEDAEAGGTLERPPVVIFMGHVDHGKTSLLDAIRNTRVAAGEHGGITQHIGAYSVDKGGKRVTFLDTPGHEAFSAMRARGANLTDVAVLVVAADDGVMPQTEEAVAHARNAGVPMVVAINKCDLPSANPDRVRQELANRLGLLPEEWGGQVGMINVSAHTRKGLDELLERVLLEAEVLELRSNPARPATGHVIEAMMSEGQGVVATLLVGDGTLRAGDVILCSNGYGRIRFMFDEFGQPIAAAGPGTPVRASGLSDVPEAGDKFFILSDLLKARAIAGQREREARAAALARRQHVTLENLTSHLAGSGKRELSVIVKADVMGSLEVIEKTLRDMATPEVGIRVIHAAVGGVNHADVILADASDAIILGFHVGAESQARNAAANLGVQIRAYHVIYRIIEDMRAALEGLLPPEEKEVVQGHVEIRQVFRSSKVGAIAGCYVLDGQIQRANRIRLFRNQVMIYEGAIQSLRRVRDDVREVKAGFECGVKIAGYDAIEERDVMEAFSIEEIARKL